MSFNEAISIEVTEFLPWKQINYVFVSIDGSESDTDKPSTKHDASFKI